MATVIDGFRITRYQFPRQRVIGDSQILVDTHHIGSLELFTRDGLIGLGFFGALQYPLPPRAELERTFATESWPALRGQYAAGIAHRLSRPRGGNIRANLFGQAIDQAVWDLHGKEIGLPLFRLLGGTERKVRAYASGLEYHLPLDAVQAFFAEALARGFNAFKMKVGNPDVRRDIERMRAVRDAVGTDALLMVDANEAWSPKEAISRAHAYRDAGISIYWIEDPCLRDDFDGLALVAREVPFSHINTGEYLDLHGKRRLLEHRAADILNVHGGISDSMRAAWLASDYGIAVSLGNTPFELGVHLAAALAEPAWLEYSFQDYDAMITEPVQFENGYALAPERPGLGLELSAFARAELARPNP